MRKVIKYATIYSLDGEEIIDRYAVIKWEETATTCVECPYSYEAVPKGSNISIYICTYEKIYKVGNANEIPEWCPIEPVEEEEQLRKS